MILATEFKAWTQKNKNKKKGKKRNKNFELFFLMGFYRRDKERESQS